MSLKHTEYETFDICNIRTVREFKNFVENVYKEAQQKGWTDLKWGFTTTTDYDDYSEAAIEFYGSRPKTPEEEKASIREGAVRKVAREKGISYHEASTLYNLRERKKIDF